MTATAVVFKNAALLLPVNFLMSIEESVFYILLRSKARRYQIYLSPLDLSFYKISIYFCHFNFIWHIPLISPGLRQSAK